MTTRLTLDERIALAVAERDLPALEEIASSHNEAWTGYAVCPECFLYKGHHDYCPVGKAIDEVRKATNEQ